MTSINERHKAEAARLAQTEYGQTFIAAGFEHTQTGGGCTAWGTELPHEGLLLITTGYADGDCSMSGEPDEKTTSWQVGEQYWGEGAPAEADWEYREFPIDQPQAAADFAKDLAARRA